MNEIADAAGVTIGSLYHHFGSKHGLYRAARIDIERRLLDRMEGARAAAAHDLATPLEVGFDYLVDAGFARMLSERPLGQHDDPVEIFIATGLVGHDRMVAKLLAAAWRLALESSQDEPIAARAALRIVMEQAS